jgi:hypothetical protein
MTGRRRLLSLLFLVPVVLIRLSCSGAFDSSACPGGGSGPCTRVLFIGNTYTGTNDLPAMFANLARSGKHRVQTGLNDDDAVSLTDHVASPDTKKLLASTHWTFVVLQEQSMTPSIEEWRQEEMYPAARELVDMVRGAGATPLFFLTWAHRDGLPETGPLGSYAGMQKAVDDAYLTIAAEEHAPVAPVGYAWWTLYDQDPGAALWQDDGTHPSVAGTYLAACVFYAAIFRESPSGLGYRAGLPGDLAAAVQKVAADVVLGDPAQWGLG